MAKDLSSRVDQLSQDLPDYAEDLDFALKYLESDPRGALTKCRRCTERLILGFYRDFLSTEPPQKGDPLEEKLIKKHLGHPLWARLRMVRDLANPATHVNDELFSSEDAEQGLEALCDVLEWQSARRPRSGRRPPSLGRSQVAQSGAHAVADARHSSDDQPPPRRSRIQTVAWVGAAILVTGLGTGFWWIRQGSRAAVEQIFGSAPAVTLGSAPTGLPIAVGPAPARDLGATVLATSRGLLEAGGTLPTLPVRDSEDGKVEAKPSAPSPMEPAPIAGPDDREWTRQNSTTTATLYAVTSDTSGRVFAVGASGLMLMSLDGGTSWRRIPTGTSVNLLAVAPTTDGQVFAVGSRATVLLPRPFGSTSCCSFASSTIRRARGSTLWAAYGHGNGELFVGGDEGVLLRLGKDGQTMESSAPQYGKASIRSIAAWDEQTLYAVGDKGTVLRGALAGRVTHWEVVPTEEKGTLWQVGRVGNQLLIAGEYESGQGPKLLKQALFLRCGSDLVWDLNRFLSKPANPIYSFVVLPSRQLLATGYVGSQNPYYLSSSNEGATWERNQAEGALADLRLGRYAVGGNRFGDVFIVGINGTILHKRVRTDSTR